MTETNNTQSTRETSDKGSISDMLKELAATGLATIFMTEEGLRNYLKEKKFPIELVSLVLDGLSRKKDDLYSLFGKELGQVFAKVDVSRELSKFLEQYRIKLNADISFEPKNQRGKT